jgi:hypothetical protein
MDFLTHLFLPITVAYVLRPELFPSPWYFLLAGFAVFPDVDKLFQLQGVLHSGIILGVIGMGVWSIERLQRNDSTYATLVTALLYSDLFLDVLDGGPVTFLYPFVDAGIGMTYPAELVVRNTFVVPEVHNPLPEVTVRTPNRERETYPLVDGYGMLSAVTFFTVYVGQRLQNRSSYSP